MISDDIMLCPRCKLNKLNKGKAVNSLSYIDHKTPICKRCRDIETFLYLKRGLNKQYHKSINSGIKKSLLQEEKDFKTYIKNKNNT